jgi:hypothetical protein
MLHKIIAVIRPVRLTTVGLESFFCKKYVCIADVVNVDFCA